MGLHANSTHNGKVLIPCHLTSTKSRIFPHFLRACFYRMRRFEDAIALHVFLRLGFHNYYSGSIISCFIMEIHRLDFPTESGRIYSICPIVLGIKNFNTINRLPLLLIYVKKNLPSAVSISIQISSDKEIFLRNSL